MKLDQGLTFRKLSLDLTPLIDVVFLLVLFFAVSTSFISREDLAALKENVVGLSGAKETLSSELSRAVDEVKTLKSKLARADQKTSRLETSVEELTRENKRIPLLQQQLDQASRSLEQEQQRTQTLEASVAEQLRQRQEAENERDQADEERSRLQARLSDARGNVERLEASAAEQRRRREQAETARDQVNEERGRLEALLGNARGRIEELEGELAKFRKLAALDQEQIDRILETQQILQSNLDQVVKDKQLNIKRDERLIILQLSDRILFDSGSAEIKPQGAELLAQVGNTIKSKLQGLSIQVAGHTDNVPVSPGQGNWSDNWSLSAARAVNVLHLLEDRVGIDPRLLSAVGYGEYHPVADNDTAEGRAKNRRIELVLVPQ